MRNAEVSEMFSHIADLLEIRGENPFRVRAYRRAADVIAWLPDDVETVAAEGRLRDLEGIGEGTEKKVLEFLETGTCQFLEDLLKDYPPTLLELLRVPELGPKKVAAVYEKLGIATLSDLEAAASSGQLRDLPGFAKKTEENILRGLAMLKQSQGRALLNQAEGLAQRVVATLEPMKQVKRICPAGSLRRLKETIGDIDILVDSDEPEPVMEKFTTLSSVSEVLAKGTTKSSVVMVGGLQVDVRVLPSESFGAALQYFTGSKDHNVALRELAIRQGFKLSEYGLFREGESTPTASKDEESVYQTLGLQWIPPELRENRGEIAAAKEGALPRLVDVSDFGGDFHAHSDWTDGSASIPEMAEAARALGYSFLAITDHSKALAMANGLDEQRLLQQAAEIRKLNGKWNDFRLLTGIEVDILADGSLDLDEEVLNQLDVVVASVHSRFKMPRDEMTERMLRALRNPVVDIVAHPTGRLIGQRGGYEVNIEALIDAAAETDTALEVNSFPERLDLSDAHCRKSKEKGVRIAVNSDAHSPAQLGLVRYGLSSARRGWLEAPEVLNTWPLEKLLSRLGAGD